MLLIEFDNARPVALPPRFSIFETDSEDGGFLSVHTLWRTVDSMTKVVEQIEKYQKNVENVRKCYRTACSQLRCEFPRYMNNRRMKWQER